VLAQVAPLILERQGLGKVTAVLMDKDYPRSKVRLGDYTIEARYAFAQSGPECARGSPRGPRGPACFIQLGPDDYAIVGRSESVYFESATDPAQSVGLATVEEGQYVDGRWVPGRRLNGDETPDWRALWFPATATPSRRSSCTATGEEDGGGEVPESGKLQSRHAEIVSLVVGPIAEAS